MESEKNIIMMKDLIGTPFYMTIDIFSTFNIEKNEITFSYDIFKNDVYAIGMIASEFLMNQLDGEDVISSASFYKILKVENIDSIDSFLRLAEEKIKIHFLMVEIIEYFNITLVSR